MKKDVVINVEPQITRIRRFEGGFTWTFNSQMKNSSRRKIINITFDRWWLSYLSRDLKKVLQEEITELNRLRELMGFKD